MCVGYGVAKCHHRYKTKQGPPDQKNFTLPSEFDAWTPSDFSTFLTIKKFFWTIISKKRIVYSITLEKILASGQFLTFSVYIKKIHSKLNQKQVKGGCR